MQPCRRVELCSVSSYDRIADTSSEVLTFAKTTSEFISYAGLSHTFTSVGYPQSNGKSSDSLEPQKPRAFEGRAFCQSKTLDASSMSSYAIVTTNGSIARSAT
jgi:hypothetical protein